MPGHFVRVAIILAGIWLISGLAAAPKPSIRASPTGGTFYEALIPMVAPTLSRSVTPPMLLDPT